MAIGLTTTSQQCRFPFDEGPLDEIPQAGCTTALPHGFTSGPQQFKACKAGLSDGSISLTIPADSLREFASDTFASLAQAHHVRPMDGKMIMSGLMQIADAD